MGGGGFSTDGVRSPLDEQFLALARERRGTDRPRDLLRRHGERRRRRLPRPVPCRLRRRRRDEPPDPVRPGRSRTSRRSSPTQDAIYVGGGNTASLLAVWRAHGLDRALRAAHDAGIVLAGVSAGSICWFESGTTDSYGPTLQPVDGALGFIPGSHSPHYDGEPQRRPTYHALVGSRPAAGRARRRRPRRGRCSTARTSSRSSRATTGRPPTGWTPTGAAASPRRRCPRASCHDRGRRGRHPPPAAGPGATGR